MRRDESGSMVIWMMGLVMVVLLLAGLCLDPWRALAAQRSLAAAVDAAAAAGANGIDEAAYRTNGTIQLYPPTAQYMAANTMSQAPEYRRLSGLSISATPARVTVRAQVVVRLTLMRLFVINDLRVSATSDAAPRRSS